MSNDKKDEDVQSGGMNILEKIIKAIRVESKALSEAVMDSAGSNKFEQQLEDAKSSLQQAKTTLTEEMTKELQSMRLINILEDKINQQELLIVDSLSQGDEDKAFKLATEMVELEQDKEAQSAIQRSHELHLGHLKRQMENAERSLKDLERQMAMVNTTEGIQKATAVITKNFNQADSNMLSAKK
ncbi:MAG: PspA/IM30 family protein, partial [Marinicella sp.]